MLETALLIAGQEPTSSEASLVPRVWCWYVAPLYALCRQSWRQFKMMIPPALLAKDPNESTMTIELVGGILIEFKSAERDEGLFGSGLDFLAVDEAAMIDDDVWTTALRPRLSSPHRLGLAAIGSTPKGRRGWFFEQFTKAQSPDVTDTWALQAAMADTGMVAPEEIEDMRRTMPALKFEQEVEGKFISSSGEVFRNISECRVKEHAPATDGCSIGIDLASRRDRTACIAIDRLGYIFRIGAFTGMTWEGIVERIKDFVASVGMIDRMVVEQNGVGDPIVEQLIGALPQVRIEPFITSSLSKQQIVESLALAVESKKITWPSTGVMTTELENELALFSYEQTRTGGLRYAGRGTAHDDLVMATALAWSGCPAGSVRREAFGLTVGRGIGAGYKSW
jgi:hypothetical protein